MNNPSIHIAIDKQLIISQHNHQLNLRVQPCSTNLQPALCCTCFEQDGRRQQMSVFAPDTEPTLLVVRLVSYIGAYCAISDRAQLEQDLLQQLQHLL